LIVTPDYPPKDDVFQLAAITLHSLLQLTTDFGHTQMIWYDMEDFSQYFRLDVNENQIKRLTEEQKQIILEHAHNTLEYFSYI